MEMTPIEQKEALAEAEFEQYEFGDGVTVVESDNWDSDDEADFIKIVYVEFDNQPEADSQKVSFHVRFNQDGSVANAYGLLTSNGAEIGRRRRKP